MLAMHDRARRAGGFPGQFEIEPNMGERLVEAGLVDFLGVRHTLDRRDQIIPGSASEIIVQVLFALDVGLRRGVAAAPRPHQKMAMCRTLALATQPPPPPLPILGA